MIASHNTLTARCKYNSIEISHAFSERDISLNSSYKCLNCRSYLFVVEFFNRDMLTCNRVVNPRFASNAACRAVKPYLRITTRAESQRCAAKLWGWYPDLLSGSRCYHEVGSRLSTGAGEERYPEGISLITTIFV